MVKWEKIKLNEKLKVKGNPSSWNSLKSILILFKHFKIFILFISIN